MRKTITVLVVLLLLFWQIQPIQATIAKKGVERLITFVMKDTAGVFATGLTVTASVSQDGGAFDVSDNSVTEVGGGLYKLTLSASEMTSDILNVWLTASGASSLMVSMELADFTFADIETLVDGVEADTAAILIDTAVIGALGAGLSNIPWNTAWDAEVQSEVVDAMTAEGYTSTRAPYLDELAAANLPTDIAAIPTTDLTTTVNAIYGKVEVLPAELDTTASFIADITESVWARSDRETTGGTVDTVTNGVTLANDAITSAKYDESTAFPVKADDAGVTQIARVGADGDTLETVSDQIDAIPTTDLTATVNLIYADSDELQTNQGNWLTATGFMLDTEDGSSFISLPAVDVSNTDDCKANVSGIPTIDYTTTINLIHDYVDVLPANLTVTASVIDDFWDEAQSGHVDAGSFGLYLDAKVSEAGTDVSTTVNLIYTDVEAIKAITDVIPDSGALTTIQADLDDPNQYKADVSAIPTTDYTTTVNLIYDGVIAIPTTDYTTTVNLIYDDTDELQTNQGAWATATGFSTFDSTTDDVTISGTIKILDDLNTDLSSVHGAGSWESGGDITTTLNLIYDYSLDLYTNQGDWLTATGFMLSTEDGSSFIALPAVDVSNTDDCKADVSGIPTTDYTTTINAIYADTNEIQTKLPTNYIMGSSVVTDKDDEIDDIPTTAEQTAIVDASLTTFHTTLTTAHGSGSWEGSGDVTTTLNLIYDYTSELQTDWVDGGRLDLILDIVAVDTTTDIPALIATAQADLDNPNQYKATGFSTFDATLEDVTVTSFTTNAKAELQQEATDANNAYDAPTRAELTSDKDEIIVQVNANETKIDLIPLIDYTTTINLIYADSDELQTNQGNWLTATGFMLSTEDGSSFTAIPWNASWDTEVQSEATDALDLYDAPTNAEMIARTLLAGSYYDFTTDQVIVTTNNDKTGYSLSGTITTLDALNTTLTTDHGAGSWEGAGGGGDATEAKQDTIIAALVTAQADLDTPNQYKATVSGLATSVEVGALNDLSSGDIQTAMTAQGYTSGRAGYLDKLNVTGTLANSDDADTYKATSVSVDYNAITDATTTAIVNYGVATATNVSDAESNIRGADSDDLKDLSDALDLVPTTAGGGGTATEAKQDIIIAAQVTAQADLDNPAQYKATVAGLATSVEIAALNDPTLNSIVSGVAAQVTLDHGTGSYITAGASGANTITLQISDTADSSGIPRASVLVCDSLNTTILWSLVAETTPAGLITTYLDNGTYSLRIFRVGYIAENIPETLVVSGDTTVTYYMGTSASGAVGTAETCAVTINVTDQSGAAYANVKIIATFLGYTDGRVSDGGAVVLNTSETKLTGVNGQVTFTVPREGKVNFDFAPPLDAWDRSVTIPDAGTADFKDLPEIT